ncbi:hypothetical protein DRQ25_09965 [Candidatus Fermentibacteria bacterium]|nr:MAG: hypothetical protein DRQ25_09965 [Candidatus Fermentibacteria bacterium]
MNTVIPLRLVKKLARESRGSEAPDFLEVLLAEAVARRWFLHNGVSCWRTPQHPPDKGRYSLLFSSGRRAIVVPAGRRRVSFDIMADARCDYLLTVEMKDTSSGYVSGFFYLFDIRKPGTIEWRPDLEVLNTRSMDNFPELSENSGNFKLRFFLQSLRLLIMGDRKVPHPIQPGYDNK